MKADDQRVALAAEAALIEKNANYASEAQFEASNLWRTVQLWVTIPAAVLAAIAGGTALATTAGRLVAGCVAVVATSGPGQWAEHKGRLTRRERLTIKAGALCLGGAFTALLFGIG